MSKYTTELRFILESEALGRSARASEVETVINNSINWLFDFSLPANVLTTSELESFKRHFCLHYYNREIAFETVGLFKNRLMSKMWDIIPYYSQMYELQHKDFDLFTDIDRIFETVSNTESDGTNKQDGTVSSTGKSKANNSTEGTNLVANSDTPQTAVDIESLDYVSNLSKSDSKASGESTTDTTSEQKNDLMTILNNKTKMNSLTKEKGINSSMLNKYLKYRDSIINIEMMMIKECEDLFFQLW